MSRRRHQRFWAFRYLERSAGLLCTFEVLSMIVCGIVFLVVAISQGNNQGIIMALGSITLVLVAFGVLGWILHDARKDTDEGSERCEQEHE